MTTDKDASTLPNAPEGCIHEEDTKSMDEANDRADVLEVRIEKEREVYRKNLAFLTSVIDRSEREELASRKHAARWKAAAKAYRAGEADWKWTAELEKHRWERVRSRLRAVREELTEQKALAEKETTRANALNDGPDVPEKCGAV